MTRIFIRILVSAAIVTGVVARIGSLDADRPNPPTGKMDRQQILRQIASHSGSSASGRTLTPFRYSDLAEIILGFGKDAQPGQAGLDDNRNGIIDDRNEIGAVGSDDVCLAPADHGYDQMHADPNTIVISHGAYVVGESVGLAERYQVQGIGWFIRR